MKDKSMRREISDQFGESGPGLVMAQLGQHPVRLQRFLSLWHSSDLSLRLLPESYTTYIDGGLNLRYNVESRAGSGQTSMVQDL
jgi:hypothetical protein